MEYNFGTEGYYNKMLQLQERLRKSEEERLILEEKFNEMIHHTRDAEHDRLRLMRHRYHKFLEEDKIRQERNENILRALDRIDSRAKMLAAKTSRFKAFRKQYETHIRRIYHPQEQQPRDYTQSNVRKKLFSDLPAKDDSVENKLAMLEQYLRDNFDNFPRDTPQNKTLRENRGDENGFPRNRSNYERHSYFNPPDSDSKDSQEIVEEYNKYPSQNLLPPTKGELLGKTIEQELERLKNKEPIKQTTLQKDTSFEKPPEQVIQDYKDLVSKSEEKYGLRGESPVRRNKEIVEDTNRPNIFDNATKTLNIDELKNLATPKENTDKITEKILLENVDSESENPVIKNYKNMLKSFQDDVPSIESNNLNDEIKVQENDTSEQTEPPSDISLNLSSNVPQDQLPVEQIYTEPENNDISLDEPTIKEQLHSDAVKENKLTEKIQELSNSQNMSDNKNYKSQEIPKGQINQNNIQETVNNDTKQSTEQPVTQNKDSYDAQQNISDPNYQEGYEKLNINQLGYEEGSDKQNINQSDHQEGYDKQDIKQPEYQEGYDKQNIDQSDYQEGYDKQNLDQPDYQEVYDKQNIDQPDYQEGYDEQNINQPDHPEGYDKQNMNQPDYQEGYDKQNINQPDYQEGYDKQNINHPDYQEGYDMAKQNTPGQQTQKNMPENINQPVYQGGYDMAEQNTPDQQAQQNIPNYQEEGYDKQNINHPDYQEGYDMAQQNMPDYQEGHDMTQHNMVDQQPEYQEGHEVIQQNMPEYQEGQEVIQQNMPDYQEGHEVIQQNMPEYQEGYDSQQNIDPNYQEGYEGQYYEQQQNQEGYDNQQYEGQPMYPEGYDPQQYPTDQPQYQEYANQEYQPQEYTDQQYPADENVYRSEQDYLEGEQNVDKQYENEQQAEQQENNTNLSSTEKSISEFVDNKPLVEKTMPNLSDLLDTDTESMKQETKISNESDFDLSKS